MYYRVTEQFMLQFTVHCTVHCTFHQINLSTVHHTLLINVYHIVQRYQTDLLILLGTLLFLLHLQCCQHSGQLYYTFYCVLYWTQYCSKISKWQAELAYSLMKFFLPTYTVYCNEYSTVHCSQHPFV